MNEFLATAFSMPTAIFSVLLALVILYWLLFIFGLFDLGIFDGLFEGAVEGAAEGAVEGAVEGVAEGAAEGLAEGAADGVADGAADGLAHPGCFGLMAVGEVPVTLSGTILIASAWLISYGGTELLAKVAVGGALAAVGLGLSACVLALAVTSVAVRPLRRLFRIAPVTVSRDLVKRICRLTTLRVDAKFGQAEVDDDGAGLLIQVRCLRANDMTRGDRAIIYEYDAARSVFMIAPLTKELSETYKAHGAEALAKRLTE